jgi:hypothetical protein
MDKIVSWSSVTHMPVLQETLAELSELIVVRAEHLRILAASEVASWYPLDDGHDGNGHDKGPAGGDADPGQLLSELDEVAVEPAAGYDRVGVVEGDRGLCKETGQEKADGATDRVARENVHRVIKIKRVLEPAGR